MSIEKDEHNEPSTPDVKPVKVKKPRTAKQLAADERLREMGKKRAAQRKLDKEKKLHENNQKKLEENLHKICDVVEEKLEAVENKEEVNLITEAVKEPEPEPEPVAPEPEPEPVAPEPEPEPEPEPVAPPPQKKKRVPKKKKVIYYSSEDEETDSDTELVYVKKEKPQPKKKTVKTTIKKEEKPQVSYVVPKRTNRFTRN